MAQQQLSKRQIQEINKQGFGDEPDPCPLDMIGLIRVINWYSALRERDDAKQYLTDYCRVHFPGKVDLIDRLPESSLDCTMCWLARITQRGSTFDDVYLKKLHGYILGLDEPVKLISNQATSEEISSPRDGKFEQLLMLVEGAIDNFDTTFSCYDMLVSAATAHRIAGRIADYYQPQLEEITLAVEKKDQQCMEAYSHLKYSELRKLQQMVGSIVEDARRFKDNLIKARKPKKNSTAKAKDVFRHFKFQEKDDSLKISSINPSSILGAKELYVYNTARKTLTLFKAKEGGLKISRSSIDNYSTEESLCKRVSGRNLPNVIKHIETSNARARVKALQAINSDPAPVSDRISTNVVLLRALK